MSSRYTNMWGEDLEEQQKRREWLRQVYDNAVKSSVVTQIRNTYNQALDTADKLNQDNTINNDKYKHAYISCKGAQSGALGVATIATMGIGKEIKDWGNKSIDYINGKDNYKHYSDIIQDGIQDLKADARGIYVGFKNPDEDCEDMISQFYPRYIK